jgi:hypothetical protein
MNYRQIKQELRGLIKKMQIVRGPTHNDGFGYYKSFYLGSYPDLDPCGRYHHVLSPNEVKKSCINFWNRLERAAEELDCWIESGRYDGLDVFLCKSLSRREIHQGVADGEITLNEGDREES